MMHIVVARGAVIKAVARMPRVWEIGSWIAQSSQTNYFKIDTCSIIGIEQGLVGSVSE